MLARAIKLCGVHSSRHARDEVLFGDFALRASAALGPRPRPPPPHAAWSGGGDALGRHVVLHATFRLFGTHTRSVRVSLHAIRAFTLSQQRHGLDELNRQLVVHADLGCDVRWVRGHLLALLDHAA